MTHPVPPTDPDPRATKCACGHTANVHSLIPATHAPRCSCKLTSNEVYTARVAELEAALDSLVYGLDAEAATVRKAIEALPKGELAQRYWLEGVASRLENTVSNTDARALLDGAK